MENLKNGAATVITLTTIAHHHLPAQPLLSHNINISSIAMDPSTAHQKSIPGSDSAAQAANVPNGYDGSEERIPSADGGATDDDTAVYDGVCTISAIARVALVDGLISDKSFIG